MLEFVWFAGLMVLSIVFALVAELSEQSGGGFDSGQWQIASHGAALLAVVISWDRTGAVLLKTIQGHLPQAGTQIAALTGYTLVGAVGLMVVGGIPFITMMTVYMVRKGYHRG